MTLNLNGFEISGRGTDTFTYGVSVSPAFEQTRILNGRIRNARYGIWARGNHGSIETLRISDCDIGIVAASHWTILDCHARDTLTSGFSLLDYGTVRESSSKSTGTSFGFSVGNYATIIDCVAHSSGSAGFDGGSHCTVRGSSAFSSGRSGFRFGDSTVIEVCRVLGSAGEGGFVLGQNSQILKSLVNGATIGVRVDEGSTVREVEVVNARNDGFVATGSGATFVDCKAISSDVNGFDLSSGTTALRCRSIGSSGHGFVLSSPSANASGGSLRACVAEGNTGDGIYVFAGSGFALTNVFITDCEVTDNGTHGIRLQRVGASQVVGNRVHGPGTFGVTDPSTPTNNGNLFFDNLAIGFTNAFVFDGNSSWGALWQLPGGAIGDSGEGILPRPNFYR